MAGIDALKARKGWMLSKLVDGLTPGKKRKIPTSAYTLQAASVTDPTSWATYDEALTAQQLMGADYMIGYALSESDPFWFLDVDECLDAQGQPNDTAQRLLAQLDGAAVEVSSSGRGLHIVGSWRAVEHSCRDDAYGLEFYSTGRLITIAQLEWTGDASGDFTEALAPVLAAHFAPVDYGDAEWSDGPRDTWHGPDDDDELIAKACKSGSPFKATARFVDLWEGNADKLADSYPTSQLHKAFDNSQADLALAQHLAFWTGCDCERIERLMKESGLARDKYERPGYLRGTILRAVGRQREVLGETRELEIVDPLKPSAPPQVPSMAPPQVQAPVAAQAPTASGAPAPAVVSGLQFMGIDQQVDYFRGCVYVRNAHRALTPDGSLLKPDQFKAYYGGYIFALDATHNKTTKSAWEAFTESQAIRHPKVHALEFDPLRPPGAVWVQDGSHVVNSWVPYPVPRVQGDPAPFLDHLQRLIPDANDRAILLAYMAACVQHQGVKFQWCPLIQGTEGNGKSLFSYCVKRAIGNKYSHTPNPQHIANNFNGWMWGKTFFMVEDIYVPEQKLMIWEALKPMITGKEGIQIELKGVDAVMARVCGNFILNSNHKDAVKKTRGDRRVAPFYTAQQTVEDLEAAGMTGDYFPRLYGWLQESDGYAIVADYLYTYPIPDELNPATKMHRAPNTTSTAELLELSTGGVEQEVLEAIDEGRPGFAGGFVSSWALDQLLVQIRAERRVPRNKRSGMMEDLGYVLHPALPAGRLTTASPSDGNTRPRIYVKAKSIQRGLSAAQVAEKYAEAQTKAAATMSGAGVAFGVR